MALTEIRAGGLRSRRRGAFVLEVEQLAVRAGEPLAILGPNGAGKSTLLRHLAGLDRPAAGEITPAPGTVRIAYAFQRPVFLRGSVRSNLQLALGLQGIERTVAAERIATIAEALGISGLLDQPAATLSGGEAQRANLARALSLQADLTLLDEPLSGVDGEYRDRLLAAMPGLLARLPGPAVVVTHSRVEATLLSRECVVLIGGRVVAAGRTPDVLSRPPSVAAARVLGFTILRGETGVVGIAPGELRGGDVRTGDRTFDLVVEASAASGTGALVSGRIQDEPVTVAVEGAPPATGSRIRVTAPGHAVVEYDA